MFRLEPNYGSAGLIKALARSLFLQKKRIAWMFSAEDAYPTQLSCQKVKSRYAISPRYMVFLTLLADVGILFPGWSREASVIIRKIF